MPSESLLEPRGTTVLVTGGTGFVAIHLILQLLTAGYRVRTTICNITASSSILQSLREVDSSPETLSNLSFFTADLTRDEGWPEAVRGCTYIHHLASPFPSGAPKNDDELIVPAREGTLRVLRVAREAGIKRVIITSSFATVGYGHPAQKKPFTEESWPDLTSKPPLPAYHKSKTLAERTAWDFISLLDSDSQQDGKQKLELTVLNPVGMFGPVPSANVNSSVHLIQKLLDGSIPACPESYFGMVDVRDLADLHILAMLHPAARDELFIAVNDAGAIPMIDIARMTVVELGGEVCGLFAKDMEVIIPLLGTVKNASNEKAKSVLGWKPRTMEETVDDIVDSLVKFGMVKL